MVNRLDLLPNEILAMIYSYLSKSEVLICMGGDDNYYNPLRTAEFLHKTKWNKLPEMLAPRDRFNAVGIDNFVYIVGGHDGKEPVSTMESFDFQSRNWRVHSQMNTVRTGCVTAAVQVGNSEAILVSGGRNNQDGILQTAEVFNTQNQNWTMVANMRTHRTHHCGVVFESEVFAIGGYDGFNTISTCEKYSPVENQWHDVPNMRRARQNAAATVANKKIFVAGGQDRNGHGLASVEVLNPSNAIWVNVSNMNSIRSGLGLATFGDMVIAVGGVRGWYSDHRTVEVYDIENDLWTTGPALSTARWFFALTTVEVDNLYINELKK